MEKEASRFKVVPMILELTGYSLPLQIPLPIRVVSLRAKKKMFSDTSLSEMYTRQKVTLCGI